MKTELLFLRMFMEKKTNVFLNFKQSTYNNIFYCGMCT